MDFVCNNSIEIEKKSNSKNKDLEDAKARMEKVQYKYFVFMCISFLHNCCMIMQPGQSERELNPYWKNGGTGLPPPKPSGFLKPKTDDDDDIFHCNSYHQSNHSKPSYSHQSWKKHDRRDEKNNSKHDTAKRDSEAKYKQHKEYDERKEPRNKFYEEHEDKKRDKRNKCHTEYDDEKNKRRRESDDEYKGKRDKRHRNYEDERREEKDKHYRDNYHKKKIKSKYRDLSGTHDTVEENQKETHSNKYVNDNEKSIDYNEDNEKPLTDSELNALAAKQIKAELMGNTVSSCSFFLLFVRAVLILIQ